jgi:hypothetical protein
VFDLWKKIDDLKEKKKNWKRKKWWCERPERDTGKRRRERCMEKSSCTCLVYFYFILFYLFYFIYLLYFFTLVKQCVTTIIDCFIYYHIRAYIAFSTIASQLL